MSQEHDETTNETSAKPTITIAEKEGSDAGDLAKPTITIAEKDGTAAAPAEAKPTITIAEKDGGE